MRTDWKAVAALALASILSGTTLAQDVVGAASIGDTKENPVEVCQPSGERGYLSKLTCQNGDKPSYARLGSYGPRTPLPRNLPRDEFNALFERAMRGAPLQPGDPDYHVVDGYELTCGAEKRVIYMDMYHCESTQPLSSVGG